MRVERQCARHQGRVVPGAGGEVLCARGATCGRLRTSAGTATPGESSLQALTQLAESGRRVCLRDPAAISSITDPLMFASLGSRNVGTTTGGNILTLTDAVTPANSQAYTYDTLDRLSTDPPLMVPLTV